MGIDLSSSDYEKLDAAIDAATQDIPVQLIFCNAGYIILSVLFCDFPLT